jgi:ubiquinone/menaquinone biosynthesis C-methylase UbiE
LSTEGAGIECEWGKRGIIARAIGIKRVHLLYLMRIVSVLEPRNILEVGFGNGVNLFVLSSRFPEIKFSGIELTEGGVRVAADIQNSDELPDYISRFSPGNVIDSHAHKKLKLLQGNATSLKFKNNQFDMVYTNLALEQMNEVKEKALSEISRVSSKYVVMVEPFYDWNNEGINKHYIKANDYFSATLDDLSKYNLEVIYTNTDLPHKLTFTPGIVVAKVTK